MKRLAAIVGPLAAFATAFIFAYSAWSKWAYPGQFRLSLAGYGLSVGVVPTLGVVVPVLEMALAVAIVLCWIWQARPWLRRVLWLSVLVNVGFIALMSWALAHGLGQNGCGCFSNGTPLNIWDIFRDVGFAAVGALGAWLAAWRPKGDSADSQSVA